MGDEVTSLFQKCVTQARAIANRNEVVWASLGSISLAQATDHFLKTLEGNTQRAYRAAFQSIFKLFLSLQIFHPQSNLQAFAICNLEYLLDEIRMKIPGSEATKQSRAAAFISLTRYLQRATGGIIRIVVPKKEKNGSTFQQIRETSVTKALTKLQWTQFLFALKKRSFRDYLVAKTMLQGAKRVGEVLKAQIDHINWSQNQITFKQLKSKQIEKYTIITYPKGFMEELRQYLGERKTGFIFTTKEGKPLSQPHLYRTFSKAGLEASLPFNVHPHMLRASAITYLSAHGFHSDQILKISGHSDSKLVRYYDKTLTQDNISRDVQLI